MDMKKDWSLRLALALPFAMMLFVAASIYLPRLWAPEPKYGFVYSDNSGYSEYILNVVNGKLVKESPVSDDGSEPFRDTKPQYVEPHLYRYDAATKESKSITMEEAQALKLDDRKESPDGFEAVYGGGYGGPFGGGSASPAVYLSGHSVSHKLDLRGIDGAYDFNFIGWVSE